MTRENIIKVLETMNTHTLEEQQAFDEIIQILKAPKVAYICDRKVCSECPGMECRHTLDITHAVNFEDSFNIGSYMEKIEEEPK